MPKSTLRSLPVALLLSALPALMTLPPAAHAQTSTLSWTETSSLEVAGAIGLLLRAMPGALETQTSQRSLHIQDHALIQEDGRQVTLIDAENRRVISVDHDARTFMTFSFDESGQAAAEIHDIVSEARAGANEALGEVRQERDAEMAELHRAMDEARAALDFRIESEETGRTRTIEGAGTAAQHIITAELAEAGPPQGIEDAEAGTLVFVMELWQSRDLPTPEAFVETWGASLAADPEFQTLAHEIAGPAEDLNDASATALASWDPRLSAGLIEISDALHGIDGTTVSSTLTVALVADGETFDREELLDWEPESMGDRLREETGSAAREAVASAARNALGGLFGGRDKAEEEPVEELPAVRPLFRMTTSKADFVHGESAHDAIGSLEASLKGYREITLEDLTARTKGR